MNGPDTATMVVLGLGALGFNLFLGILIWALAFKSGAVGAAAQTIDRAVCEGREAAPAEPADDRPAEQRKGKSTTTQDARRS